MDTLFWTRSNPNIAVEHTTKKYFGKYLYKVVVYCPAGRLIDGKGTIETELAHRREVSKNINPGGWWGNRFNKDLDNADPKLLAKLRDIRHDRTLGIKLRVEEPRIQIYAETNDQLVDFVNTHIGKAQLNRLESVAGPIDESAEDILNTGAILRKTDIGYRYKVILRDGRYTPEIKRQLFEYLTNLGPEIQLPKSARQMLQKNNNFIWNLYFYSQDPQINSFINLISPGIVSNCHELVVMSK